MDKTPFTYDYNPNHKKNAARLIKLLERLPNSVHKQCDWGNTDGVHQCKTTGCALGLAAMYNVIPGLQYRIAGYDRHIVPIQNGASQYGDGWNAAGRYFFGDHLMRTVFWQADMSKNQIIKMLKRYVKTGKTK